MHYNYIIVHTTKAETYIVLQSQVAWRHHMQMHTLTDYPWVALGGVGPGVGTFVSYLHQMIANVWELNSYDDFSSKVLPDIFTAISNLKNYLFIEWFIFLLKCAKSCILMSRKTYHKISLRILMLAELWPKSQKKSQKLSKRAKTAT